MDRTQYGHSAMIGGVVRGGGYLIQGLRLISLPGLRRFVLIPMAINILLFAGGLWLFIHLSEPVLQSLLKQLPSWLGWLNSLLWLLFTLVIALILLLLLSLVAGLVAAPFNAFLAEAVERHLDGENYQQEEMSIAEVIRMTPHLLMEELRKLRYMLVRTVPLLLLSSIPVVNLIAP
ncbi:MAG: sulfate transporter CysZ, partial [Gammaproteobacteria bacterium]|nr:sulfate transporter CysZ [Gammaproteobacteria bacterium]